MTSASSPQNRRQVVLRPSFRRAVFAGLLSLFLLPKVWATPLPQARNALQIYSIDVEGGQATLFVTPGGQSLLIDTGWPGDRKSTRLNSSHLVISYAVFCLKKKKT